MKKLFLLTMILMLIVVQGCVKNTVNIDKISEEVGLSPSYVLAAVKGDVTLGDLIEPNDTIFFDDLGLLTLVYKKDSIINFSMDNFYESFPIGNMVEDYYVTPIVEVVFDTVVDIEYGSDFQIKELSIIEGSLEYSVSSTCSYNTTLKIQLPGADDGGSPLEETVQIIGAQTVVGEISLNGVVVDFTSHPNRDYNALALIFTITPDGSTSDLPGTVSVDITLEEPEFDYVSGYFGQQNEMAEAETLDLDMDELFNKIDGSFNISNPKITVNYSNSFGIPLRVETFVTGENSEETINLDRAPEDLLYPTNTTIRDVEGSFIIDKTNSKLPEIASMLPNALVFLGSASANPDGDTGTDNIIFGDSRFIADMEIEVPMEFWINNIQLTDTLDNFLLSEEGEDSVLDMISDFELRMYIDNGFPLGGSLSIVPYDSLTNTLSTALLTTGEFFDPAEVDAEGKVTSSTEKTTKISMSDQFINDVAEYDKLIVVFTLFTTGSGDRDVKLYSDYSIIFKAAVALKANLGEL